MSDRKGRVSKISQGQLNQGVAKNKHVSIGLFGWVALILLWVASIIVGSVTKYMYTEGRMLYAFCGTLTEIIIQAAVVYIIYRYIKSRRKEEEELNKTLDEILEILEDIKDKKNYEISFKDSIFAVIIRRYKV